MRESTVPGDPKECREHAKTCLRMASETNSPQAKETFENLAQTWLRLAADLEAAKALIDKGGNGPTKPS
jgi:hypothetical protein